MQIADPPPISTLDRIPQHIHGVKLDSAQRNELNLGNSVFLENMQLKDGRIVDGKVNLIQVGKELKLKLNEKKAALTIPSKILGKPLSQQDREALNQGKFVPIKFKGSQLYLQLDSQLNRIVVKTEKELGIPKEIGGHKLTDKDKVAYANNLTLPTRLYFNPESKSYFLANIKRTPDGRGLEFSNYKPVEKQQAAELKDRFNKGDHEVGQATTQNEKQSSKLKTFSQERFESFETHIRTRNFSAIKSMTDKGFTVSKEQIKELTTRHQYTSHEKQQLESSVKIKAPTKNRGQGL